MAQHFWFFLESSVSQDSYCQKCQRSGTIHQKESPWSTGTSIWKRIITIRRTQGWWHFWNSTSPSASMSGTSYGIFTINFNYIISNANPGETLGFYCTAQRESKKRVYCLSTVCCVVGVKLEMALYQESHDLLLL